MNFWRRSFRIAVRGLNLNMTKKEFFIPDSESENCSERSFCVRWVLWLNPQIDMKTISDQILEEVVKNAEYSNAELLKQFYVTDEVLVEKGKIFVKVHDRRRDAFERNACRRRH